MIDTIAQSVVAALIYSGSHFLKKSDVQDFDGTKLLSTLIVGASIGIIFALNDPVGITRQNIETQLIAFAGLTGIVENCLKMIGRRLGIIL